MDILDFRLLAEEMVNKLHIFDEEWREVLISQYCEMIQEKYTKACEYFKRASLPMIRSQIL